MFDTNKIIQALNDYNKYTGEEVKFEYNALDKLASSAYYNKSNLRELLRKHPNWDEELWAVKVPIELTREKNISEIENQVFDIFKLNRNKLYDESSTCYDIADWVSSASAGVIDQNDFSYVPKSMTTSYPKAWHKGRKLTKILRDIFIAYGVWSDEPGDFQRQYAALTDMLRTDTIKTTLFISINPCHFLTMSNPKWDRRGDMLTSCHSLNNSEYDYNNGCSGYARDSVTMICFTVADPKNPETLNNRKTSRQLFMYNRKGILLQSRMYNSEGGTSGVNQWSKTYFEAVSKVINKCEGVNTGWKSTFYNDDNIESVWFQPHEDFGGYADWEYEEFCPVLHYRENIYDIDTKARKIVIGASGMCLMCGDDITEGAYCYDCRHEYEYECDDCGWETDDEDDLATVYSHGRELRVCRSCLENNYTYCDYCDEYYPNQEVHADIHGDYICDDCIENGRVITCSSCGEFVPTDEAYYDETDGEYYCPDCYEEHEIDLDEEEE